MKSSEGKNPASLKCEPCEGTGRTLSSDEAKSYLVQLEGWQLAGDARGLSRNYVMRDFMAAVDLIRRIAQIAEEENHHPDLHLEGYRRLRVELSTHALGGLTVNDFVLAAKIENLSGDA